MRKFRLIETGIRKERLDSAFTKQTHLKIGFEFNESKNEKLIEDILTGIHMIRFKAIENKEGGLSYFKENKDYISSIYNFYKNKYPVKGIYFKDLLPLEQNRFEGLEIECHVLRFPMSKEDLEAFNQAVK